MKNVSNYRKILILFGKKKKRLATVRAEKNLSQQIPSDPCTHRKLIVKNEKHHHGGGVDVLISTESN